MRPRDTINVMYPPWMYPRSMVYGTCCKVSGQWSSEFRNDDVTIKLAINLNDTKHEETQVEYEVKTFPH